MREVMGKIGSETAGVDELGVFQDLLVDRLNSQGEEKGSRDVSLTDAFSTKNDIL